MEELLFLAHRIPYPPNKGDKIRSWHMLSYLAERYRVHLGCFVDDPDDWRHADTLAAICGERHMVALNPRLGRLRGLAGMVRGEPITLGYFRDRSLARWVARLAADGRVRRVVAFSSSMAQYVLGEEWRGARRIFDFVDVDSDKWRQYAAAKRWPARAVYQREARTLLAFERRAAAIADATLLVSEEEAALFRTLAPESGARVSALANGVDARYFDPARGYADPYPAGGPVLVFTGAMDYWANIDAVTWFAREALPGIRAADADARFWIVGTSPTPEVRALAEAPGVTVTGRVEDVRPYVAHAAVAVAPLRLARGVQNKVLEAMAMARPVVASPQALEGIRATPGRELAAASDAQGFAAAVRDILADRAAADALGRAARDSVVAGYGWDSQLTRLTAMLEARTC